MNEQNESLPVEKKYYYYENSVQNPEGEVETLQDLYRKIRGKDAKILREDFVEQAIMCNWVKQGPEYKSFGIDLDPEPVEYGKKHHYSKLTKLEQERVRYIMGDVFKQSTEPSDLTIALNFSYYIFKERKTLVEYFKKVYNNLADDGVFVIDLFGGPESMMPLEEKTKYDNFKYYWDCDKFNPITNECLFYIHFKPKGDKKYKKVFTYDWRMWGFSELRDVLSDAGFSKTIAYWEGDDDDGAGNGEFYPSENEDNCESWVSYIAALK